MNINGIGRVGINPYNKQIEKMEKVSSINKKDQLEISTEALELQKGNPIEAQRQKLVEDIKNKVDSGEYEIDPAKIAEKMYSFWNDKF